MDEQRFITMWPVKTAGLAELSELAGIELPRPSIEHSLTRCGQCGRDCWIGPAQAFMRAMQGTPARCFWCVLPALRQGGAIRSLDRTADSRPRRTGPPQAAPRRPAGR